MGDVKKYLSKGKLPEREKHNSRLFVDLAENIHIHHREYRTVFSIDEFLEYTDVILKSRDELLSYLEHNPDYQEMKYPTTIWVSGGRKQQLKFLQNSLAPNKSVYYNDDIAIELQEEYVADEVHIHFRDFRIVCNRKTFKEIAINFTNALMSLNDYEEKNTYIKQLHPDSEVKTFNQDLGSFVNSVQGSTSLKLQDIKSHWYANIELDMNPNQVYINDLISIYKTGGYITPIVVSTEENKEHLIVDGHHRYYAALKAGETQIPCIILNLTFPQTKKIREAEVALKEFDKETGSEYNLSHFFKSYISMKTNRFYDRNFEKLTKQLTFFQRLKRKIKTLLLGKKKVFFSFYEQYRK